VFAQRLHPSFSDESAATDRQFLWRKSLVAGARAE
jgi:hypothetical protein